MPRRKVIHVVFKQREGKWRLRGGADRAFGTKAKALDAAKREAKAAGLGQVVVHTKIGGIQTEYTYGSDPRRTKG